MKIINFFKFVLSSVYRKKIRKKELIFVQSQIISISSEIEELKDIARRIHKNAIDKNSSYETQRHTGRNEDLIHNYQLLGEYQRREKYLKEKLEEAPPMNKAIKKTILLSLCFTFLYWFDVSLVLISIFFNISMIILGFIFVVSIWLWVVAMDFIYKRYSVDVPPSFWIILALPFIAPIFIAVLFFGKYL